MATRYFNGDAGAAQGLNYTRTVPLSGGSALSDIRTDSVIAYAFLSTNAYTNTYQVRAQLLNSAGYTLAEVTRTDIKFNSSNFGGATWEFNFGTGFDQNAIASISFFGLNEASKIFVKSTQSVAVNYTPITLCTAPTAASVAPSLCENDPTLSASGAAGGSANAITGYEIQYAESANGTTYGAWEALKTVSTTGASLSTTVTLPSVRAYSRKYRLRTLGAAGSSYYSGWAETNAIKRNSLPTAPTSFTAAPEVYVSGEIALTYSGAADPDGNLITHNVQYATKSGVEAWSAWANLTNGITAHTPTLSPGQSIKYRVRAVDALGAVSDWLESNSCVKNTAPAAPTVNYPQAGRTIYNSRPRLLVTLGADPEGHTQRPVTGDFAASRADGLTSGAKIVLRRTSSASAGAISYSIKSADQYNEESTASTGSLTYTAPSFTDATITGGTTRIKAAHMTELRTMIEAIRAYYGFGVNHYSNATSYGTYTDPGQLYPLEVTGRNADDYLNGFAVTGSNPGGANYLRFNNVIDGNGYWTVSFDLKGTQSVSVPVSVDICDIGRVWFYSNASNTYERKYLTVNVTNYSSTIFNFVDFSDMSYLYYKFQNIKVERGTTSTTPGNSMDWSETITAGVTKARNWQSHILEMRAAVDDVVALVNGWDTASTVNRISTINWIPLRGRQPQADVLEQIRQVIAWL